MSLGGKRESLVLLTGDLACFVLALWLTLLVRYWSWPVPAFFGQHLVPFAWIFLLWVLVFFIADLYRRRTAVFEKALPTLILRAQAINSLLAAVLFYFFPYFRLNGITPRFSLLLDLFFSLGLVILWRLYLAQWVYRRRPWRLMIASEDEAAGELATALQTGRVYPFRLVSDKPEIIAYDKYEAAAPGRFDDLYDWLFRGASFVCLQDLYEEIFGRVPLPLLNERWFLEQISVRPKPAYDLFKRLTDLLVAGLLGGLSLIAYPFIALAIKLDDGGPVFYRETRVGRNNQPFTICKFRSMSQELELGARRVTRVGRWLRRSRLDELPQLWSVVVGYQSLIGPRAEREDYVRLYRDEIPFYDIRHLIAPGLSGWAQIYQEDHPHFTTSAAATREKLSYDLYYLKNRSWWLDVTIALKTIRTLLSRKGI